MSATPTSQLASLAPQGLMLSHAEAGLERQWFTCAADEAPCERVAIGGEEPAPPRFIMASWPEQCSQDRLNESRQRRRLRQPQRPNRDLRVEIASLVELLTSYFLLLGGGAMRGKARAAQWISPFFARIPRETMPATGAAHFTRDLFCTGATGIFPAAIAFSAGLERPDHFPNRISNSSI